MSELEHYGMKERRASAKGADEANIAKAAPPAEAAEAAEPAKPAKSTDNSEVASASTVSKISLDKAFGDEDSIPSATQAQQATSTSSSQKSKEEVATRDPFEPAPPTPDSIVTNVIAAPLVADSVSTNQDEYDSFASQTGANSTQTPNNEDYSQAAYGAHVAGYTPSYDSTNTAYNQGTYAQSSSYSATPTPTYQSYNYAASGMQDPYGTYGSVPPKRDNKAIGALVCGILSLIFCWTTVPGIVLGIAAVALAGSYVDLWGKSSKTTAAKVTGVLGIVASTLVLAFSLLSFALFSLAEDLPYSVNSSSSTEESSFLDLLPLDEFGSIVTGKDSPNAPLSGQERAAAEAAMDGLKQIPKNTSLLTILGTNADAYFADMNGGIRLKDIGLSGSDVVRWLVDNMECSVANDGVFITDSNTAMVFIDASAPTMWTYTDAATQSFEQKYGEAEMDTEKEYLDALGDSYKTASTTAEVEDKYLSLNLTNRNGTWVVDSDSLLQQAEYLFDLWS